MVAIITGDIISSRKIVNQEKWLSPLNNLLESWGETPKDWKLDRGDFFQLEIKNIDEALNKALQIKALIKFDRNIIEFWNSYSYWTIGTNVSWDKELKPQIEL